MNSTICVALRHQGWAEPPPLLLSCASHWLCPRCPGAAFVGGSTRSSTPRGHSRQTFSPGARPWTLGPTSDPDGECAQVPVTMQVHGAADSWLPIELPPYLRGRHPRSPYSPRTSGESSATERSPLRPSRVASPVVPDDWVLNMGSISGAEGWPSPRPALPPSPSPSQQAWAHRCWPHRLAERTPCSVGGLDSVP